MKIAVMGTGGIGGYVGGRLAQAGQEVTFIARGRRLRAIRQDGLQVHSPDANFTVKPARVTDDPAQVGPVDLIVFAVKAYDTASAAEMMHPMVGGGTAILPVQNGIRHLEQLNAAVGPAHVLGGMCLINAHSIRPGIVERPGGSNRLEFGEIGREISSRCRAIEEALVAAGVDAVAVPNIVERMWWKFAAACGIIGVFSVVRGEKAQIWDTPEVRQLIRRTIEEAMAVARGQGIDLDPSLPDDVIDLVEGYPPQYKPSMLVDLERGQPLEVEALNGAVAALGKEVGVSTPANDFIYACLKPYVNGRPQPPDRG